MKVFHITPRRNKTSILELGLLTSYCHDDLDRIYLCNRGDVAAMARSMQQRHETSDVCILYVDIGQRVYCRENSASLFLERDIAPEKILGELLLEHV